jgi:protein-L-isoaspartate(D-aspartate) O-methyltransferase
LYLTEVKDMRVLLSILIFIFPALNIQQTDRYVSQRDRMVKQQIISRGISDKLTIEAMKKVPRHMFVPRNMQDYAYDDSPLPIGYGQTISQPYIVALMTETVKPGKGKTALEIGTGSGYQAAVLAEITDTVYTIEIVPELAKQSAALFSEMGYTNIVSKYGDGYRGWPEYAPFDIIIVTAAPDEIPQPLLDQLAEGGHLVIPVGGPYDFQELILVRKQNGKLVRSRIASVRFVPFKRL